MSDFYCPRCGTKSILDVYPKAVTTPASGPFVIGHIGGNPNLPMIGARLNAGTSRVAYFCKTCGEEAHKSLTLQEFKNELAKEAEAKNLSLTLTIIVVVVFIVALIAILINHDSERRANKAALERSYQPLPTPAAEVSPTP
jgi:predicted RNA-binding Zn-ribbon protein involved in translation (DUF1610 family)